MEKIPSPLLLLLQRLTTTTTWMIFFSRMKTWRRIWRSVWITLKTRTWPTQWVSFKSQPDINDILIMLKGSSEPSDPFELEDLNLLRSTIPTPPLFPAFVPASMPSKDEGTIKEAMHIPTNLVSLLFHSRSQLGFVPFGGNWVFEQPARTGCFLSSAIHFVQPAKQHEL